MLPRPARRHLVPHALFVGIATFSVPLLLSASEAAKDEVVRLAPFKVRESNGVFELDVRTDPKTQLVQEIRVSWLGDKAKKARLERGDILVAIDDRPVAGRSVEDIFALRDDSEPPGTTHKPGMNTHSPNSSARSTDAGFLSSSQG